MKKKPSIIMLTIACLLAVNPAQSAQLINQALLDRINTDGDETSCSISGDSRYFIFARKQKDKKDSDLYFTEYKNGRWSDITAAATLNSDSDDISPYLTPDGKFLLFASNRTGSLKSGNAERPSFDIYFSEKKGGDWEKPELLFGAVNTGDDETTPSLSDNGKILYFTRTSAGGSGSSTIIRVLKKKGSWEDVYTAGISSNTGLNLFSYKKSAYKDDDYAVIFSGGTEIRDIFRSDSSGGKPSDVKAIDSLNSPGDELSVAEIDRDNVIVATNTGGKSGSYDFFLKKTNYTKAMSHVEPVKSAPVDYTIILEKKGGGIPADIRLMILYFSSAAVGHDPARTEVRSADTSGIIRFSSDENTKRILILPAVSGIKPFSVELFTDNDSITTSTVIIEPAEQKAFTPRPVYFDFNSSSLKISDMPYLHELVELMKNDEGRKLLLSGYADGVGSYNANINISVKRAESVKEYLVKSGINGERITLKGHGFVKGNDSDTAQYHRRVDFSLTE